MVEKKEIAARVGAFSAVYVLISVLAVFYFEVEWLLVPLIVAIVVWGVYVYRMNVKVLGMPVQSMGIEGLEGLALTNISEGEGKVKVRGEIWNARSARPIKKREKIRVVKREGITLEVELVED